MHVATQSTTYKVEVDKVHLELEEWQRLIEHQRTAIGLQEIKVEKADTTVDVHRQEKEHFEKRCAQLEEDVLVKEKTIAARRSGVKTIIFPEGNKKDYDELSEDIREGLDAHFVSTYDEVYRQALDWEASS